MDGERLDTLARSLLDGRRFDTWTRAHARGMPRRVALKALLGIALAGAGVRIAVREAEACEGFEGTCKAAADCCAPYRCIRGLRLCLSCLKNTERCQADDECCSGNCGFFSSQCKGDKEHDKKDDKKTNCEGKGCKKGKGGKHHHGH